MPLLLLALSIIGFELPINEYRNDPAPPWEEGEEPDDECDDPEVEAAEDNTDVAEFKDIELLGFGVVNEEMTNEVHGIGTIISNVNSSDVIRWW